MSYSRGTDTDRAARVILYRDGRPVAIAYDKQTTEDIQRIVDESIAAATMLETLQNAAARLTNLESDLANTPASRWYEIIAEYRAPLDAAIAKATKDA